jgi:hypothetical protein
VALAVFAAGTASGQDSSATLSFPGAASGALRVVLASALAARDTGIIVEVHNGTNHARAVAIRFESSGDAEGLAVSPDTLRIPARTSGVVRLMLDPALIKRRPGLYGGYVVASAGSDTVRREIELAVDRRSPVLFIGTAWTVRVVRSRPLWSTFDLGLSSFLPLPADADTALLDARVDAAALQGPEGAVAFVRRDGPIRPLTAGVLGLKLAVDSLTTTGDYTGTLTLSPGVAVPLTVRVTDFWAWPAGAILLGILLAWGLQRYTTVERAYWQLRASVLRVASQWNDTQQRYSMALYAAVGNAAGTVDYALDASFRQQCQDLLAEVDALGRPLNAPLDASNTAYAAAQQRLAQLQVSLSGWPDFAGEIGALNAAINATRVAMTALHTPPPDDAATMPSKDPPTVMAAALALLRGGPITVANLAPTRAAVVGMTAFLAQWVNYAARVVRDRHRIAALAPRIDKTHAPPFEDARGGVAKARDDLQWAVSAADWAARGTEQTLNGAERQLNDLEAVPPAAPAVHRFTELGAAGFTDAIPRVWVPRLAAAEQSPAAQARQLLARVRLYDVLLLTLTLLVALVTGFKQLYLGQNTFGTLSDYLSAILWGFGTKYTLETLLAVVGRFFGPALSTTPPVAKAVDPEPVKAVAK